MPHPEFIYPAAALALLTFIVMALMLKERIAEMTERRIHPQSVPSSTQMSATLKNTQGADNYKNLLEMPVLFYVLCVVLMRVDQPLSPAFLYAAWAYVALRYAHSWIHLGRNKVMQRAKVFAASVVVLMGLWGAAVWQLS